jgi:hypothetical protein
MGVVTLVLAELLRKNTKIIIKNVYRTNYAGSKMLFFSNFISLENLRKKLSDRCYEQNKKVLIYLGCPFCPDLSLHF